MQLNIWNSFYIYLNALLYYVNKDYYNLILNIILHTLFTNYEFINYAYLRLPTASRPLYSKTLTFISSTTTIMPLCNYTAYKSGSFYLNGHGYRKVCVFFCIIENSKVIYISYSLYITISNII